MLVAPCSRLSLPIDGKVKEAAAKNWWDTLCKNPTLAWNWIDCCYVAVNHHSLQTFRWVFSYLNLHFSVFGFFFASLPLLKVD